MFDSLLKQEAILTSVDELMQLEKYLTPAYWRIHQLLREELEEPEVREPYSD